MLGEVRLVWWGRCVEGSGVLREGGKVGGCEEDGVYG